MRLLIDANNIAYRADKTQHLTTKQGESVGAIYGVIQMLNSYVKPSDSTYKNHIMDALKPYVSDIEKGFTSVVTCWDVGKSAFRLKLYPDYKGQREIRRAEKTEEEKEEFRRLIEQMNILRDSLPIFGVKSLSLPGWEADDLIYTTTQLSTEPCVVVSTDADMLQLVSENVFVWQPFKSVLYTLDNFEELTGVKKDVYLQMRTLVGDSSDNIPGIHGIGPKTAAKLLNEYGSLEGIIKNHAELMKKKTTARIFENIEILDRNDALMNMNRIPFETIKPYVQEALEKEESFDMKAVKKFLIRYQFVSILKYVKQMEQTFGKLS
ncbi:DNA polymerase [Bacillus phage SP-10]|uniref:DNA polymerase n=1 Tax=Bacillus phage SP10 TaxID=941058 RepID=UPI0002198B98|nr:DNA polymerase [Bacillus phage SP-10]BAK53008.1 DNA polymerase [Bacillus phage SP-10]